MTQNSNTTISVIEKTMDLPRSNGELVFKTPWEGRAFAMAVLMNEKGMYPWTEFNGRFVEEIGEAERAQPGVEMVSAYYQHWVQAFEKLLIDTDMITSQQLEARTEEFVTGQRHHLC